MITMLLTGVGAILFFSLRTTPVNHQIVMPDHRYHLTSVHPGLFNRLDDITGMPNENGITLQQQDQSYMIFENNWTTMRINFIYENGQTTFYFIVHSVRHQGNRRGFKAIVTHIYDGALRTYTITTSPDGLVFRATVIQRVTVASTEFARPPVEEIFRTNSVIMKFAFDKPSWVVTP